MQPRSHWASEARATMSSGRQRADALRRRCRSRARRRRTPHRPRAPRRSRSRSMHVLRITARNHDAGIRPLHPVERPKRAQAAVLNGILGHAGVPGDPPREVMRGIEVHEDLLPRSGRSFAYRPIAEAPSDRGPCRFKKTWNRRDFIPDPASAHESGNNAAVAGVFIGRRLARVCPAGADRSLRQSPHETRHSMTSKAFDRRDFLKLAGLGGVVLVSGCASTAWASEGGGRRPPTTISTSSSSRIVTGASKVPPSTRMRRER